MDAFVQNVATSNLFKDVFIPLACIVLTIGLRVCSKKKMNLEASDCAIGLELLVTAVALLALGIIELGFESQSLTAQIEALASNNPISVQQLMAVTNQKDIEVAKLTTATIYLVILIFSTFILAMLIRGFGWRAGKGMNNAGVWIPTIVGVSVLTIISSWMGRL